MNKYPAMIGRRKSFQGTLEYYFLGAGCAALLHSVLIALRTLASLKRTPVFTTVIPPDVVLATDCLDAGLAGLM